MNARTRSRQGRWLLLLSLFSCSIASADSPATVNNNDLQEIVVTSGFRPLPILDVPASATVLDAATLRAAGQQHFEDVLALIPNFNWAGDTSRPRYFQIRGIGELEQYQGAPNPSIGFLIDDIDFSGLGTAATMFDIDQVEVLRGPQATRYGANALGGLIYVRSAAPSDEFNARVEADVADYNTRSIGAAVSGPVAALDSSVRLAAQRYTSDGYYHNVYLNRYDTDSRDELTLRGRWRYQPSEQLQVDLSVLHVQIDNGYDAYSPDNSRTTHSNDPSVDSQHSTGTSLRVNYAGIGAATFTGIATLAVSRVKYGYDGDWGNAAYWAPYVDEFTELQYRDRTTQSLELRLATSPKHGFAWLVGLYAQQLHEELNDTSAGISDDPINGPYAQDTVIDSGYRARGYAAFGVLDGEFTTRLKWSAGLRGERRTSNYHDSTTDFIAGASQFNRFGPAADLWGGHLALTYALTPTQIAYLQLARGYKAGGFNLSQGLLPQQILFDPESDLNMEAGYKADLAERRLSVSADVFYLYRRHAQIKSSLQTDPNNPNLFVYYTGNASSGTNFGLETELRWAATPTLALAGSLGLLQTAFHDFVQIEGSNSVLSVSRELANAPHWQSAISATYRSRRGAFARLDLTGVGSYYFDLPPNDTRSKAYALVNSKIGWESIDWSLYFWGRNLLNKDYPVRGFFFGLVPPDYPNRLYLQLGDPRTFGANVIVRFGAAGVH